MGHLTWQANAWSRAMLMLQKRGWLQSANLLLLAVPLWDQMQTESSFLLQRGWVDELSPMQKLVFCTQGSQQIPEIPIRHRQQAPARCCSQLVLQGQVSSATETHGSVYDQNGVTCLHFLNYPLHIGDHYES